MPIRQHNLRFCRAECHPPTENFCPKVHLASGDFRLKRELTTPKKGEKTAIFALFYTKSIFFCIFFCRIKFLLYLCTRNQTKWWIHLRARIRASHARHRGSNPLSTTKVQASREMSNDISFLFLFGRRQIHLTTDGAKTKGVDLSTLCERRTFVKATRRAKGKTNER